MFGSSRVLWILEHKFYMTIKPGTKIQYRTLLEHKFYMTIKPGTKIQYSNLDSDWDSLI